MIAFMGSLKCLTGGRIVSVITFLWIVIMKGLFIKFETVSKPSATSLTSTSAATFIIIYFLSETEGEARTPSFFFYLIWFLFDLVILFLSRSEFGVGKRERMGNYLHFSALEIQFICLN